jgi:hypothetical protein
LEHHDRRPDDTYAPRTSLGLAGNRIGGNRPADLKLEGIEEFAYSADWELRASNPPSSATRTGVRRSHF